MTAPAKRTASVGVDVDSLWHYYRIHGLDERSATNAVWRVGVPRFVELFTELGVPATFYCVAEDLDVPGNRERLRALASQGFEIGNHSLHHRYDLTRMSDDDRVVEVGQGRYRLEMEASAPVVGFRSPGYNTSAALIADVRRTGHTYDSSVFPCAPYYLAKATILGWMRLRSRESRSVLGDPRVLLAPHEPYVMDPAEPHVRGTGGLAQFPISVAAGGVPLIGTAFTALGLRASVAAAAIGARTHRHLTLEFHAADLLSLPDDGLDPALAIQPDLRVRVARKRAIFRAVLATVAARAQFVRLCDLQVSAAGTGTPAEPGR